MTSRDEAAPGGAGRGDGWRPPDADTRPSFVSADLSAGISSSAAAPRSATPSDAQRSSDWFVRRPSVGLAAGAGRRGASSAKAGADAGRGRLGPQGGGGRGSVHKLPGIGPN